MPSSVILRPGHPENLYRSTIFALKPSGKVDFEFQAANATIAFNVTGPPTFITFTPKPTGTPIPRPTRTRTPNQDADSYPML